MWWSVCRDTDLPSLARAQPGCARIRRRPQAQPDTRRRKQRRAPHSTWPSGGRRPPGSLPGCPPARRPRQAALLAPTPRHPSSPLIPLRRAPHPLTPHGLRCRQPRDAACEAPEVRLSHTFCAVPLARVLLPASKPARSMLNEVGRLCMVTDGESLWAVHARQSHLTR